MEPTCVSVDASDSGRLLSFFACPELHWEYVRTSNPIERVFLELRRQQFGWGVRQPRRMQQSRLSRLLLAQRTVVRKGHLATQAAQKKANSASSLTNMQRTKREGNRKPFYTHQKE